MIVVKVELWSAVTGQKTELARMEIANKGDHPVHSKGNYTVRTLRGRSTVDLDKGTPHRSAEVSNWPRLALHVWNLVAVALSEMGYGRGK
jgi:hypothetical protein